MAGNHIIALQKYEFSIEFNYVAARIMDKIYLVTWTSVAVLWVSISIQGNITLLVTGGGPAEWRDRFTTKALSHYGFGNMYVKNLTYFPFISILVHVVLWKLFICTHADHFVYAPSQWKMTLQCNVVSHWLGACNKMIPDTSWHQACFNVHALDVKVNSLCPGDTCHLFSAKPLPQQQGV